MFLVINFIQIKKYDLIICVLPTKMRKIMNLVCYTICIKNYSLSNLSKKKKKIFDKNKRVKSYSN